MFKILTHCKFKAVFIELGLAGPLCNKNSAVWPRTTPSTLWQISVTKIRLMPVTLSVPLMVITNTTLMWCLILRAGLWPAIIRCELLVP